MSNISIQKMGFCRNDHIKYSSQFQVTLLCDDVHMHFNSILAFAFLEDTCKKSFDFLRSNYLPHPAKSSPTFHMMALNNPSRTEKFLSFG